VAAHNAATASANAAITTSHLVLGLIEDPDSPAATAIASQGFSLDALRDDIVAALPPADDAVPEVVPYAPEARKAIELAFREAIRLGHDDVGDGHLLLALLRSKSSPLTEKGVDAKVATTHVAGRPSL